MADVEGQRPRLLDFKFGIDDRGVFAPFSNAMAPDVGKTSWLFPSVKRAYYVRNFAKGTVRGFHLHRREWKFFAVALGAAKFVCIVPELDQSTPAPRVHTLLDEYVCVLSDRRPEVLAVPPGWANGWMSLTEDCVVVAMSTSTFEESVEDDFRFPPDRFEHYWTVKGR